MTTEPLPAKAHRSARAPAGPGQEPVELIISVNSKRITELETRLSTGMGVSDDVIQDFQRQLTALQSEIARIAAFVDQTHHDVYSGGGRLKRPVLRVIRGERDRPSITP